ERWVTSQRFDLGGEGKAALELGNVQGLDAVAVANECQSLLEAVPDGEREHPVESAEGIWSPFGKRRQHDFGVGTRSEDSALRLQFRAQLEEVVDLAVVRQDEAPVRRKHRLLGGVGEIDDGEAPMPEAERSIDEGPLAIGSPVVEGGRHGLHDV